MSRVQTDPEPWPTNRFLPGDWWVVLLHGARAAHDPRKLLLALGVVLLLLGLGRRLDLPAVVPEGSGRLLIPGLPDVLDDPRAAWEQSARQTTDVWLVPVSAFRDVVVPQEGVRSWLLALLRGLATGAVVILLGGAIARVAAHELAGRERPGLVSALRFGLRHARDLLVAPLAPSLTLVVLGLLCALVGLLFRLPFPAGPVLGGALAIVPLVLAIPMAFLALGVILGWPLMVLTISAESEDVIDALSRSYSYVYRRMARYLVLAAAAWLIGTVGWLVAVSVARLVVGLAIWGMSLGGPGTLVRELFAGRVPADGSDRALATQPPRFWQDAVRLLAYAWIFSYFWCAMTAIYLILRRDLDGTAYSALDEAIVVPLAPEPPDAESSAPGSFDEPGPGPSTPVASKHEAAIGEVEVADDQPSGSGPT
jgi:hypothetical protein